MIKTARKSKKPMSQQEQTTERVRNPDFVHQYANTIQIQTTRVDFRIRFGQFEQAPNEKPIIQEVVAISMSPQCAALFSGVLQESLQKYLAQETKAAEEIKAAELNKKKAGQE